MFCKKVSQICSILFLVSSSLFSISLFDVELTSDLSYYTTIIFSPADKTSAIQNEIYNALMIIKKIGETTKVSDTDFWIQCNKIMNDTAKKITVLDHEITLKNKQKKVLIAASITAICLSTYLGSLILSKLSQYYEKHKKEKNNSSIYIDKPA